MPAEVADDGKLATFFASAGGVAFRHIWGDRERNGQPPTVVESTFRGAVKQSLTC
jgi:hypothetical protein